MTEQQTPSPIDWKRLEWETQGTAASYWAGEPDGDRIIVVRGKTLDELLTNFFGVLVSIGEDGSQE